jgi:hypothetical protein
VANEPSRFREQIISVLLGAAIGFMPSMLLAQFQARQQQQQLHLDRQLSAVQSFSVALSATGPLFAKNEELSVLASVMSTAPEPEKEITKLQRLLTEQNLLEDQYVANLHAQSLVMSSVFGGRFKVLGYSEIGPYSSDLDFQNMNRAALRDALRKSASDLVQSIQKHQHLLLDFIDSYESQLNGIASILNR